MAKLIDGKLVSSKIRLEISQETAEFIQKTGIQPHLVVIIVGNDAASMTYVNNKKKACEDVGFKSTVIEVPEETPEVDLLEQIKKLNEDWTVHGILVQLPLPSHINEMKVIEAISPKKDVDGFHPESAASLFLGKDGFVPCTPAGVMELLDAINYDLEGKEVVVVGRSNNVGKPVALLALQKNATVTIAHSRTTNLKEVCARADVLIAAVGKAEMITEDYVKEGAVVIDIGINRKADGKLCGDVKFDEVAPKTSAITPVPGGVGPMTVTLLMKNTVEAYKRGMK